MEGNEFKTTVLQKTDAILLPGQKTGQAVA